MAEHNDTNEMRELRLLLDQVTDASARFGTLSEEAKDFVGATVLAVAAQNILERTKLGTFASVLMAKTMTSPWLLATGAKAATFQDDFFAAASMDNTRKMALQDFLAERANELIRGPTVRSATGTECI